MSKPQRPNIQVNNLLLKSLHQADHQQFFAHLELVQLYQGNIIHEPDKTISQIYFPNDVLISIISLTPDGTSIEVGLIGYEGLVGLSAILFAESMAYQSIVQLSGSAMVIKAQFLQAEIMRNSQLMRLLLRYTHAFITQLSQSSVCNRFHAIEARLSRWLLSSQDRVRSNILNYTQGILAQMLGAHRADVNKAVGNLQQLGLIKASRGRVEIIDRAGLEAASCHCYRIVKSEFEKFLKF